LALFKRPLFLEIGPLNLPEKEDQMRDENEQLFQRPLYGGAVDNPPPSLVPARTVLEGTEIRLEPIDPAIHAKDLYEASHTTDEGRAIWNYLPEGPWPNLEAYTAHVRACAGSQDRIFHALRPLPDGPACGQASFMDIHPGNGVIEIGYIWFAPALQRTRAATEALYLMLDYAMTNLRYRRMQWRCNALNAKSRAAARRLGFRYEGTFYNHLIFKGLNRDTAWYSILDDEWPDVKARLEAWLSFKNFGADGQAKQSLSQMMQSRPPSTRDHE
jgi:RimJ/RimL family protein N-acetyltransferase